MVALSAAVRWLKVGSAQESGAVVAEVAAAAASAAAAATGLGLKVRHCRHGGSLSFQPPALPGGDLEPPRPSWTYKTTGSLLE